MTVTLSPAALLLADVAIPPAAWRRAGLAGEPRATLGQCDPVELAALATFAPHRDDTPAAQRFRSQAAGMLEALVGASTMPPPCSSFCAVGEPCSITADGSCGAPTVPATGRV